MNLPRFTPSEAKEVERLKGLGRTNSQIERFFGLSQGALRNGYDLDHSVEVARARSRELTAEEREAFKRKIAALNTQLRGRSRVDGWRPDGDCVTTRPNAAPLRAVTRRPNDRGAS